MSLSSSEESSSSIDIQPDKGVISIRKTIRNIGKLEIRDIAKPLTNYFTRTSTCECYGCNVRN